jgi:CheY-like chemotaxis protein
MKPEHIEFTDIPRPDNDTWHDPDAGQFFDLSTLVKQDDLDIRAAAEANPDLTVGEYLGMLPKFESLAPDAAEVLDKLVRQDFESSKKGHKTLDDMVELLQSMGCEKFVVDLSYISGALRKKSDWGTAAAHAKQIADGFNGFCQRVAAAKGPDTQNAPRASMPLSEYIDFLDKDRASRRPSIMAVDDSPDILKAVYLVLKDEFKVFPVSDPTQVEEMLRHITPDLFLLDYKMPKLDGLDVIHIIREFKEHKDTPIIFLTAEATIDRKSAAVMLGACDFLEKPIKADKLIGIIKEHIAGYHG